MRQRDEHKIELKMKVKKYELIHKKYMEIIEKQKKILNELEQSTNL